MFQFIGLGGTIPLSRRIEPADVFGFRSVLMHGVADQLCQIRINIGNITFAAQRTMFVDRSSRKNLSRRGTAAVVLSVHDIDDAAES